MVVFTIFNIVLIALLAFNLSIQLVNLKKGRYVFVAGKLTILSWLLAIMGIFLVSMLLIVLKSMGVFDKETLNIVNFILLIIAATYSVDRIYKQSKLGNLKQLIFLTSHKFYSDTIKSELHLSDGRTYFIGENIEEFLIECNNSNLNKKYFRRQIAISAMSIVGVVVLLIAGYIVPNMM